MKILIALAGLIFLAWIAGTAQVQRGQKICAVEYYVGAYHAPGTGIPIPLADTLADPGQLNISIPDQSAGSRIYLRVKSTDGFWSEPRAIVRRDFFPGTGGKLSAARSVIRQLSGHETIFPAAIAGDGTINVANLKIARGDKIFILLDDDLGRSSRSRMMPFNFKDIDRAEYQIRHFTGDTTLPGPMELSVPNDSSSIFSAEKRGVDAYQYDTAIIHVWTVDKFSNSQGFTIIMNPAPPAINITPRTLDFGVIPLETYKTDSVTVINGSLQLLRIDSVRCNNGLFTVTPQSGSIPSLKSSRFHITFTPTTTGSARGRLIFYHNYSTGLDTVSLSGSGSVSFFSFSKSWIYFGDVQIGTSKRDSVTIHNTGASVLDLSPITSTDNQFSVNPQSVTIPPSDSQRVYITFTPTTDTISIGEVTAPYEGLGSPFNVVVIGQGHFVTAQCVVRRGWNLISNPVTGMDDSVDIMFPGRITAAYRYSPEAGYQQVTSVPNGYGYWLKFGSDMLLNFNGTNLSLDTVALVKGWNMIGSLTAPIGARMFTTDPGGLTLSQVFGFQPGTGYVTTDTIRPGKGYWIKISDDGKLILSIPARGAKQGNARYKPVDELPPAPPAEDQLATIVPAAVPTSFRLDQNYPNPFNPSTAIQYALSADSHVRIIIFTTLGQEVALLADGVQTAGYKETYWNAGSIASGIYFYRLDATSVSDPSRHFSQTRKMILLR